MVIKPHAPQRLDKRKGEKIMKKPVNKYVAAYPVDSKASYYTNCESSNSVGVTCPMCNVACNASSNIPPHFEEEKSGLWWT